MFINLSFSLKLVAIIIEILLRVCKSNNSKYREDCMLIKIFIDIVLMNCRLKNSK